MKYNTIKIAKENNFGNNNTNNTILNNSIIKNKFINKKNTIIDTPIIKKKQLKNNSKKILTLLLFIAVTLILTNVAFADLYLNSQTGNIVLNTSSTERLRVSSGGLIGIGTITPDNILTILGNEVTANAILHINASDNFNVSVANVITLDHVLKSTNSTGGVGVSILFRASDSASQLENLANISAVLYNATNSSELSALAFSTRGNEITDFPQGLVERMRIDGYGRVGINTTSPTATLHVVGNTNITTDLFVVGSIYGTLGAGNISGSLTDSQIDNDITIQTTSDLTVGGGYSEGGVTLVASGSDQGSGQFAKDILIDGAIVAIYDVEINESFIPTKDLFSLLGNYSKRFLDLFVANIKSGNRTLNITGNVSVAQDTLFVDNTSSRVGIGKTDPTTALDVSGTVTATSFSGSGSALTGISSATPPWNSSGANVFLNDTTAKVGIGTSSPSTALEVSGSVRLTGNVTSTNYNVNETATAVIFSATGSKRVIFTTNPSSWS